jgi:hypothetical protein
MSGESLGSFIVPLLFLLLFFVAGRKKKPREAPLVSKREVPSRQKKSTPAPPLPKKDPISSIPRKPSSYEVEKKQRRVPILSKDWNRRSSLQKAFVLSEVLKRIDE